MLTNSLDPKKGISRPRHSPDYYLNTIKINSKKVCIWGLNPPPPFGPFPYFHFFKEDFPYPLECWGWLGKARTTKTCGLSSSLLKSLKNRVTYQKSNKVFANFCTKEWSYKTQWFFFAANNHRPSLVVGFTALRGTRKKYQETR